MLEAARVLHARELVAERTEKDRERRVALDLQLLRLRRLAVARVDACEHEERREPPEPRVLERVLVQDPAVLSSHGVVDVHEDRLAGEVVREGAIGLLDEKPALDPELPLGRALAFWATVDGAQLGPELMQRLVLDDLTAVPVRYLSTGQRKRAALARLLGQGAAIWLLDEPLSGLDQPSQRIVAELVSEFSQGGGLAVIASHQPTGLDAIATLALEEHAP